MNNTEIEFKMPEVVDISLLYANNYNPNKMPSKEMNLLGECICTYGFLFPIVVVKTDKSTITINDRVFNLKDGYMIIDGYHRFEKLKQLGSARASIVKLDIPIEQAMQLTVLMNRIKGMHMVEKMASLVVNLSNLGLNDVQICDNLGMEAEEFIRLKQQLGIASYYKNHVYSKDWEVNNK